MSERGMSAEAKHPTARDAPGRTAAAPPPPKGYRRSTCAIIISVAGAKNGEDPQYVA